MTVTTKPYPHLLLALNIVQTDRGGEFQKEYVIPKEWGRYARRVNAALAKLGGVNDPHNLDSEFNQFCTGDVDLMLDIAKRSPALRIAHDMLDSFYENWHNTPAEY